MSKAHTLLVFLVWLCAAGLVENARAATTFVYQGQLFGAQGPVDASFGMTFRLYADAAGGDALWSETYDDVPVSAGVFVVEVGSQQEIDATLLGLETLNLGVTDDENNATGYVKIPLSGTRPFFNSNSFWESSDTTAIVTAGGSSSSITIRVCYAPTHTYAVRTYRGQGGFSFLGRTTDTPNTGANSGCDYGPWASQMLMRDQDLSSLATTWGQSPGSSWSAVQHRHRIWLR